jgi:hypothetical protein
MFGSSVQTEALFLITSTIYFHIHSDRLVAMASTSTVSDDALSPYWSDQVPGRQQLNNIVQIDYYMRSHSGGLVHDFIDIWAMNIFGKVTAKNPYYWATLPSSYAIHFQRLQFRLKLLKHVALAPMEKSDSMDVKRYLAHLDRTIDAMFDDAKEVYDNNQMDKNWRSNIFNCYLLVEFHCQKHKPDDVKKALKKHPGLFDLVVDDLSACTDQSLT